MIVNVLKSEKHHLELELKNLTIAELVKNELWNDSSVTVSAWRRDHPTKNPILVLKTEGKDAKKVLVECLEKIQKTNSKILEEAKKALKK